MQQETYSKKAVVKKEAVTVNIWKVVLGKMEDLVKGYCVATSDHKV